MNVRLPVDLYSIDQLSAVMLELHDYLATLQQGAMRAKITESSGRPETPHASALLLGLFHGSNVVPGDHHAAENLLQNLEIIRTKATVAHITLPALPNRLLKRQLTVWFRKEIHLYTFLTFTTRSDIGGGIIVHIGSHIYDFSFRQVLLGNKHRITEIFNNV